MSAAGFWLALDKRPRHIRAMMSRSFPDPAMGSAGAGHRQPLFLLAVAAVTVAGCEPTVRLEAPREPIVINLNVKIEQEVRVKVERELEDVFRQNKGLF